LAFLLSSQFFVLSFFTALALAQAPSAAKRLDVNGVGLEYVEQGSGVPVVFVHGAVADLRFWEPQRAAFSKGHRFVAYTFRYHGSGPWPDDGKNYSAKTHAADLAAFIAGLKTGPVHLVGLSYGGSLAAMVASTQPQLVRTVTLAEPGLFSLLAETPDGKAALEGWSQDAAGIAAAAKEGDSVKATKQLIQVVTGHPAEKFDELPPALRRVLLDNARTMPLLFSSAPELVTCDALKGIKAPTLVVRGERTPQLFVKTNEAVLRCVAGSREAVVPDASHAMSFDNPAGFNRLVLEFIRGK
jgi:pimeloyl-ACP methyl ester carboxylesterase